MGAGSCKGCCLRVISGVKAKMFEWGIGVDSSLGIIGCFLGWMRVLYLGCCLRLGWVDGWWVFVVMAF